MVKKKKKFSLDSHLVCSLVEKRYIKDIITNVKMNCEEETHGAWKHRSGIAVWAGMECSFEF